MALFDIEPAKKLLEQYLQGPKSQGMREALRVLDAKGSPDKKLTFDEIEGFWRWYGVEKAQIEANEQRSFLAFKECSDGALRATSAAVAIPRDAEGKKDENRYDQLVAHLSPQERTKFSAELEVCNSERTKGKVGVNAWNAMVRKGNYLHGLVVRGQGLQELQEADLSAFGPSHIIQTIQRQAVIDIRAFRESTLGKLTPDVVVKSEIASTVQAINEVLARQALPMLADGYAQELMEQAAKQPIAKAPVSRGR